MAFSDDDLAQLKKDLRSSGTTVMSTEFNRQKWLALLARLEAHEALERFIIDCLNWEEDEVKPKKWWDDFAKAHEAWCKASGK